MKKKLLGVAAAAVLFAVPVQAQTVSPLCTAYVPGANPGDPAIPTLCVSSSFQLSGTQLWMDIYNGTNGVGIDWASRVWGVAIFNAPATLTYAGAQFWDNGVNTGSAYFGPWSPPGGQFTFVQVASAAQNVTGGGPNGPKVMDPQGEGGPGGIVTCSGPGTTGGNIYQTCQSNDFVRFMFEVSGGTITSEQLAFIDWGFRAQSIEGLNDGSIHCASTRSVVSSDEFFCVPGDDPGGPQETVPEPATMALLATGLAGMAATRRRKKQS